MSTTKLTHQNYIETVIKFDAFKCTNFARKQNTRLLGLNEIK